ncbi:ABC transporter substrate-binding protein [Herminiimonas sp. KBW02]|uniref:ABC transporter substrate-binding protein n=1 Tax=Herminiimonas sp. KBW02 TaxID=2153363 RepID=UPI00131529CD|nr:ABC transporter substrate-binding protein [Herminiimonas sp. KBW02]
MKTRQSKCLVGKLKVLTLLMMGSAALMTANLAAAQEGKKIRFALDWAMQGPQAPFLIPHADGCYAKAGLDVTTDRGFGSGDTVTKVASGGYDVGFADINVMIEYNAKHPDSRLIAFFMIYDGNALSIATLKNKGITKPTDLVGKTLAAPAGDASRRLFSVLAKANNFPADSVKWVNVSPELRESMLVRGSVDAISGAAFPVYMGVKAGGVKEENIVMLRYPEYGVSLYGTALIAKPAYAAANAKAMTSMIECVAQGMAKSMKNPDAAIDALLKREPLTDKKTELERMKLSFDWSIATPWVKKNGMSFIDPARLNKSLTEVSAALDIPRPDAKDVYTDAYLPPRSSLMITAK